MFIFGFIGVHICPVLNDPGAVLPFGRVLNKKEGDTV
jgi:hypothetical protein